MSIDETSLVNRDHLRANLLPFTRKAFGIIPIFDRPDVLDIGCATGVVTLELARLSKGRVVGIDIDPAALQTLRCSIERTDLGNRVSAVRCSMCDTPFAAHSFDIIWSEGSIHVIGFEQGLTQWHRFIRPKGFLVIHATLTDIRERIRKIPECGYCLLENFMVPQDAWWDGYYGPLERRIGEIYRDYRQDASVLSVVRKIQREIEEFMSTPEYQGSVFYVCQKIGGC